MKRILLVILTTWFLIGLFPVRIKAAEENIRTGISLVLDTSSSMKRSAEGNWKAEHKQQRLTLAVKALGPFIELVYDYSDNDTAVGLTTFPAHFLNPQDRCSGLTRIPYSLLTEPGKKNLILTLKSLSPEGSTPLLDALEKGAASLGMGKNKALLLISDGEHNCPSMIEPGNEILEKYIDELTTKQIDLYTVGFGENNEGSFSLPGTLLPVLTDFLKLEQFTPLSSRVAITSHDRKVSFYLDFSSSSLTDARLSLYSSDGEIVSPDDRGVKVHQGERYYIVTVDQEFLSKEGKVGAAPWKVDITPSEYAGKEKEKCLLHVVLDSSLKLKPGFDKPLYNTGETVILTAAVTIKGRPVKGLKDITVTVSCPEESPGNWYQRNRIIPVELAEIPSTIEEEAISPLERKKRFLVEKRGVAFPGKRKESVLPLFDDGTHGDVTAGDGVYTNLYTDTKKEGNYRLDYRVTGEGFQREKNEYIYVSIKPDTVLSRPETNLMKVVPGKPSHYIYRVLFTPKDRMGNFLGPGHCVKIEIKNSGEVPLVFDLEDKNLEGIYQGTIDIPFSSKRDGLKVVLTVDGEVVMDIGSALAFK